MKRYFLVILGLVGISTLYASGGPARGHQRSHSWSPSSKDPLESSLVLSGPVARDGIKEQPGGEDILNELYTAVYVPHRSKRGHDLDPAGKGKRGGKSCAQDCSCQGCAQAACLGCIMVCPLLIQLGLI